MLDARQLSLKYICNVTYGYTSATFSGRMPAVEIADSIVQSGRETLEKVGRDQRCILFLGVIVFRRSESSKPRGSGVQKSCMETQILYSSICLGRLRIKHFVLGTTSQIRSRS